MGGIVLEQLLSQVEGTSLSQGTNPIPVSAEIYSFSDPFNIVALLAGFVSGYNAKLGYIALSGFVGALPKIVEAVTSSNGVEMTSNDVMHGLEMATGDIIMGMIMPFTAAIIGVGARAVKDYTNSKTVEYKSLEETKIEEKGKLAIKIGSRIFNGKKDNKQKEKPKEVELTSDLKPVQASIKIEDKEPLKAEKNRKSRIKSANEYLSRKIGDAIPYVNKVMEPFFGLAATAGAYEISKHYSGLVSLTNDQNYMMHPFVIEKALAFGMAFNAFTGYLERSYKSFTTWGSLAAAPAYATMQFIFNNEYTLLQLTNDLPKLGIAVAGTHIAGRALREFKESLEVRLKEYARKNIK